ncbi:MAG: aminomethyl-transferring glycine dehydrogenase [Flavobacteriales bacterium]
MSKEFEHRHIGPEESETFEMLDELGLSSLEELIDKTIPSSIRFDRKMNLPGPLSEYEYLNEMRDIASENKVYRSYIGRGYYNCIVPPVIQRNILENPGWYSPYTPYQAEIAQGRLEGLINFQTMVMEMTGMDIANASLLDEPTAAAEIMTMFYNKRSRKAAKSGVNKFFVSEDCFPQTIDVLKTRAETIGIELVIEDHQNFTIDESFFGVLLQYPTDKGEVFDYRKFVENVHEKGVLVGVCADLLSLALVSPPGEWGADAVVGNTQRFGVPLGFGGPHAAFFATREKFKRNVPGRIIGVSVDTDGKNAYRMALQTREQHIRKEKATSNICTSQALLAVMAGMYAVYHGPEGIRDIAMGIHKKTYELACYLKELGVKMENKTYFDTLTIELPENISLEQLREKAEEKHINLLYREDGKVGISLDETVSDHHIKELIEVFSNVIGTYPKGNPNGVDEHLPRVPEPLVRESEILNHEIFNKYHSELELMRYLKRLENKDFSLTHGMIPLGSCTMKLNAASELFPITWSSFAHIHPFAPKDQVKGYKRIISELEDMIKEITGFSGVSLQPNSGAQGEYTGLKVIKAYHEHNGEQRDIALIPSSAHGTNPASAVMAGMKVVTVKCDEQGNIDVDNLKEKAEKYKDDLAALMVTYPSTHGVFEERIKEVNQIIHENGGQVYMDGANLNAQIGATDPATIGADVCHLNLHKTFAIPHGGGGPGMGPIAVADQLRPFLPGHPLEDSIGGENAISSVSAAPWGSALILLISHAYMKMLGAKGLYNVTKYAILNTNYLKNKLKDHYEVLYTGENDYVAHEMIIDCRSFKKSAGIEVEDIAKRLIDYGFHAPTISFPVPGTMMIEPTESESLRELDRFSEAMMMIREEIREIEENKADTQNNVLKNAPHTTEMICSEDWDYPYSREKAVYPINSLKQEYKFWVPVRRVYNAYGDRNLMCSCPPIEEYEEETVSG